MNQQALGWQVQKHLREASGPLQAAADTFLQLSYHANPPTAKGIQECGQAILFALTSLNLALETLIEITPEPQDATDKPVKRQCPC